MRSIGRASIVGILALHTLWPCSCSPAAYGPACQRVGGSSTILLGTVLSAQADPRSPAATSRRIYRVQVDRAFKGLEQGTSEILINPDNFTSCGTLYRIGKQYLFFAQKLPSNVGQEAEYIAGGCSGSRLANGASADLEFLEKYATGRSSTRVYGKALQWVDSLGPTRETEQAPAEGAKVKLRSGDEEWNAVSGSDGAYSFDDLRPGKYTISAAHEKLGSVFGPQAIEVTLGGCAEKFISLPPYTRLAGVALDHNGEVAARQRIEVLRKNASGEWYFTVPFWTRTDEAGRFKFEGIPTGEYLLGYSVWGGHPSHDSSLPTSYYPGVDDREKATVLRLDAGQELSGLTFKLLKPDTPRRITVRVTWPDRRPPGSHLLQIFANNELVENVGGRLPQDQATSSPETQAEPISVTFTGYEEREYRISARYWVDELGGPVPHDQQLFSMTDVVVVKAQSGAANVHLILGPPELAYK